jgi:hypothetical protein
MTISTGNTFTYNYASVGGVFVITNIKAFYMSHITINNNYGIYGNVLYSISTDAYFSIK